MTYPTSGLTVRVRRAVVVVIDLVIMAGFLIALASEDGPVSDRDDQLVN